MLLEVDLTSLSATLLPCIQMWLDTHVSLTEQFD